QSHACLGYRERPQFSQRRDNGPLPSLALNAPNRQPCVAQSLGHGVGSVKAQTRGTGCTLPVVHIHNPGARVARAAGARPGVCPPVIAYSFHPYRATDDAHHTVLRRDPAPLPFGRQTHHWLWAECTILFSTTV